MESGDGGRAQADDELAAASVGSGEEADGAINDAEAAEEGGDGAEVATVVVLDNQQYDEVLSELVAMNTTEVLLVVAVFFAAGIAACKTLLDSMRGQ